MSTLEELLAAIAAIDENTTAEELASLAEGLAAAAAEINADDPSDEDVEALAQIADGLDAVRAEQASRDEAADARRARAAELAQRINGSDVDPDDDPDGGDADDDPEADPEAEPAEVVEDEAAPEPVAASSRRTPARRPAARVSRVAARGMAALTPAAPQPRRFEDFGLVASASGGGVNVGQRISEPGQLAQLLVSAWQSSKGARIDGQVRLPVARVGGDPSTAYGADQNGTHRYLGRDPVENWRRMWPTVAPTAWGVNPADGTPALLAAGGICAPIEPSYELRTVGDASRPVRDALARFGADRGGVRTMPGPVITDLDGALGVWTEANDQTPADPATKPCLTITCPDEDETLIEALTFCLQTGTFRQRFFPEQLAAWLELRDIARARQAENRLLAAIETGSTAVLNDPAVVGAAKDVPVAVEKLAEGYRWRMRAPDHPMRFIAPRYLRTLMRTDAARELAHGTLDERLVVADAMIDGWFAARGIRPTWHLDGADVFAAQGAGAIAGYPDADPGAGLAGTQVDTYLFPEGAWLWLDGGQLDLGIIRDSTLVGTNDFQMFNESFEGSHFVGAPYESWRLRMTVCANGATGAAVAVTDCG